MADTRGYRELSRQLTAMGRAPGGKALRSAALSAMLPALREAQKSAPRGTPPYSVNGRSVDPYPVRTYKGTLRTPGFASRNVARKAKLSSGGRFVRVMLGVKPLAFYAVQFIELGTSKIPKRPWLEPSLRRSIPDVDKRFRLRLKALIDKAAR